MITLLTAAPGTGKTAYAVGIIIQDAVKAGRPVFTMGIPDLLVAHLPVPPISEWTELRESEEEPGLMLPYFTFPENSLIVLDECQRVYRLRPNGSKVPDNVAAFETHRHTGVDFLLMTQHPQLLDAHVRRLVGRHIHLRDVGYLGRWFYEWPEANDPSQFRNAPVKKKFRLPKEAFSLYTSSSKHIKPIRTMPPALIIGVLALLAFCYFGFNTYRTISSKLHPEKQKEEQNQTEPALQNARDATQQGLSKELVINTPESMLRERIPLIPDAPESAPIYEPLRKVVAMPQIQGCAKMGTTCNCYTQQGTKSPVSKDFCESYLKGNRPFDPYREPPSLALNDIQQEPRTSRQLLPSAPPQTVLPTDNSIVAHQ